MHKILVSLFIVTIMQLNGCSKEGNSSGSSVNTKNADQALNSAGNKSSPDTKEWLEIIEKHSLASFTKNESACVRLKTSKNDNNIHISAPNDGTTFLDYRFLVPLNTSTPVKEKLAFFSKAGFLSAQTDFDDEPPTVTYSITEYGWINTSQTSGFSSSLCFDSGYLGVLNILDYQMLDDQGAGLTPYDVTYEIATIYKDWLTEEVKTSFNIKTRLPKKSKILLIQGPAGYYAYNPLSQYLSERGISATSLPRHELILSKAKTPEVLNTLCKDLNILKFIYEDDDKCSEDQLKWLRDSLTLLRVEPVNNGKWYELKFKFMFDNNERYALSEFLQHKDDYVVRPHFQIIPSSTKKDSAHWDRNIEKR